mmetsp:Transcript_26875/g.65313  ORF Transcript_26875/g.65313 Transcript_26875/m.65313 type:complete len:597 (+) Transcript_26875:189-1979(+)|eukprot:CAMPEP_0113621908 /NCGR_PEP_ID=MMETSP0017_2-20120614/11212_1 /TAXON_ID=2856 /ORGANISM="Cylindrotheca closterium" /LENGTH=596 /DNA_ID=CAMNT_0000531697 /DNA_START=65 /DNA_END=1855 /DNA_ORIENTATION=+ /assembly_acc=CAM_ASM_000147
MDFRDLHNIPFDRDAEYQLARKLESLDINGQRSEIRSLLISVDTDLDLAADEPYGNADQSIIVDSKDRDLARELFAIGGDIPGTGNARAFSSFGMNCMQGDFLRVRYMLEETCDGLSQPLSRQERLRRLLESRETSLRLSPLLLMVSAGKNFPATKQHSKIAKLLLRYGASPDAKDVLGKTVVHYGAGAMATPMTMEIAGMCIKAAETSDMYGKSAKLEGLQNAAMNGKMGCVGGFDVDSERRGIYIPELKKELWVKPSNIRITTKPVEPDPTSNISGREAILEGLKDEKMNGQEGILGKYDPEKERRSIYIPDLKKQVWAKPVNIRLSKQKPNLTDVKDRFGGVSLHEVMMSNRVDVAEFLLKTHGTSIHTKDVDGISPMVMTMGGGMMWSKGVGKMISTIARAEAAADRKEAKKAQNAEKDAGNFCASCNKSLGTGGMACSKCTITYYCGRDCQVKDWKEGGHKQKCKKIAAQKFGVKLSAKHCDVQQATVMSFSTGQSSQDSFRKPRGVLFDAKFVVKVQAINESAPMMIYDESRECQFGYMSTGPGFREVLEAVQREPTWDGRKTFMKASFNKAGECTLYPATAGVKNKYSW